MFVEDFDRLCEVGEGTGETVDLVDNDNVELAGSDLVQQILHRPGDPTKRRTGRRRRTGPEPVPILRGLGS
jgi:hypothetical protein